MKRIGRSRRKNEGLRRVLTSPLTPVLIGLVVVLGVGYWAMRDTPPKTPEQTPATQAKAPAGGESTPAAANVTNQPSAPLAPSAKPGEATGQQPAEKPAADAQASAPAQEPAKAPKPAEQPTTEAAAAQAPTSRSQIDRSGGAAETMRMTVYYADGLTGGLSLQPVEIKVKRSLSPVKETVEQLLNAPTALDLYSNFPAGTHSLGVNLKDGVAIVDLSPEAAEVRGTASVNTIMASLVYSLTEIPGVEAVQLWVNGSPAVLDGIDWSRPLTREDLEARNLFHVEPVITYSGS